VETARAARPAAARIAPATVAIRLKAPSSMAASSVLALQRNAGNRATGAFLRGRDRGSAIPVQRDDYDDFLKSLKRSSDLGMLAGLLPDWESADRTKVADQLGTDRFKELYFALGAPLLGVLKPELLKGVTLKRLGALVAANGGTVEQVIDVGRRWAAPLNERLAAIIAGYVVELDKLRPLIRAASPTERTNAAQDRALLDEAKAKLSRDTYLGLLPALGMYNKPRTFLAEGGSGSAHKEGPEAEGLIKLHLMKYVTGALEAGRTMVGEVSVVDDADFQMAFDRQWVDTGLLARGAIAKDTCNAFVDVNLPKRHIWVHRDLGNAGTVIHEGMHKYADPTLRNEQMSLVATHGGVSQLDEGITELFTRKVTDIIGITRGNYPNPFEAADLLEKLLNVDLIAKAYFDGQFAALKSAYDAKRTAQNWAVFALAIEKKDWRGAKAAMK
jgi:hypothetical protein